MDAVGRHERGDPPPILTLLDLFEEHRSAFEYDWRTRFHLPLDDVGHGMSWGEGWRLTHELLNDVTSHVAAAAAGWPHPITREWAVLADVYDLLARVNSERKRKPKPYPRPWDKNKKRFGRATRPQSEIRAALRARGHGRVLHKRDAAGRLRDERGRFVKS